ncbi:MAG TPA: RNA-binding domain-containing protein, partial [Pseudonocardiaceae bacterium]|nr:RNA-binding domain-containing protein [Pseudonocardiaceae bacterium]
MALTTAELTALLNDIECDRAERKESARDVDKIGQIICAFANDLPAHGKPGVLFVGVKDNGASADLPITDQLLQNLASYRDQGHILPPPSMTVRKLVLNGITMAVVEVEPTNSPPVAYKGRIWVRVGPRRGIANSEDERRLNERRRSLDIPFDARPVPGATIDDLDLRLFEETVLTSLVPPSVLAENGRSIRQRLSSLRFTNTDGVPTTSGLLTIGKDPLAWLPGAYVQFLRLDGTDLTAPIKDEKRIDGTLLAVLRQLDETLALNISTRIDLTSSNTESRTPDYPIAALQQVARNAVMHRSYENTNAPIRLTWYADRIEINSPGGPFGIVAAASFGSGL